MIDVHHGCAAAAVNRCGIKRAYGCSVAEIQRAGGVCSAGQIQHVADGDSAVFREIERAIAANSDCEISAICPSAAADICYANTSVKTAQRGIIRCGYVSRATEVERARTGVPYFELFVNPYAGGHIGCANTGHSKCLGPHIITSV